MLLSPISIWVLFNNVKEKALCYVKIVYLGISGSTVVAGFSIYEKFDGWITSHSKFSS